MTTCQLAGTTAPATCYTDALEALTACAAVMQLPSLLNSPHHSSAQRVSHDKALSHTGLHSGRKGNTLLASSTKVMVLLPLLMAMPVQSSASSSAPCVQTPAAVREEHSKGVSGCRV